MTVFPLFVLDQTVIYYDNYPSTTPMLRVTANATVLRATARSCAQHEDALTQVAHCGPCRFGQSEIYSARPVTDSFEQAHMHTVPTT